ncbi:MAG: molybdate ABC transporter substrate-binding protein [Pseudomonadales bacterium]|nr:molybdate ABC transporter substrate-binding protein [Pseudomonadales bacterium]MDP7595306.1 molybdate ABC transporter substrate-binding protein [Pseudomonadales bacterium]HJN53270.1 molybdate ABC transporter substrate-binding protein [Pseudomonadales bacterium]
MSSNGFFSAVPDFRPYRVRQSLGLLLCCWSLQSSAGIAAELTIAVAANFKPCFSQLAHEFTRRTGVPVQESSASTGILYAQIISGAPFDLFLAADSRRPELLAEQRLGLPDSRFTYAIGQLVLWMPGKLNPGPESLLRERHRLAIANPATAPYGVAAQQLLQQLAVWDSGKHQLILGNSVGQAFQFVVSGNVSAGLVAYSQILHYSNRNAEKRADKLAEQFSSRIWLVPHTYYQPIEQQAILLRNGHPDARKFVEFLKSPAGRGIIEENGYLLSP